MATIIFVLVTTTASAHGWDKKIDETNRFKVLGDFNNEAVLDNETGLVWQKTPLLSDRSWFAAWKLCQLSTTGNRAGWRLPALEELRSLVDPQQTDPAAVTTSFRDCDFTAILDCKRWIRFNQRNVR